MATNTIRFPRKFRTFDGTSQTRDAAERSISEFYSVNTGFKASRRLLRDPRASRETVRRLRRFDFGAPWRKTEIQYLGNAPYREYYQKSGLNKDKGGEGQFVPYPLNSLKSILPGLAGLPSFPSIANPVGNPYFDGMSAFGSSAISRNIPYDSYSEFGVALGELLPISRLNRVDVDVPRIPFSEIRKVLRNRRYDRTSVTELFGAAGSEYLNVVFGWIPTLGDLRNTLEAVSNSERLIRGFNDRYGKEFHFREDNELSSSSFVASRPSSAAYFPLGNYGTDIFQRAIGPMSVSGTVTERVWCSGAFLFSDAYTRNASTEFSDWVARADYLLGIRPDVENAWELTPFSWLVDWQANVGDVLKNVSYIGRDGLVLKYAYVMRSFVIDATVVSGTIYGDGYQPRQRVRMDVKARTRGNPYGFGITPEAFTPKQWSILGALGLTWAPGAINKH